VLVSSKYVENFTYQCGVCKSEFKTLKKHADHLNSHTKKDLINVLKYWGFRHYDKV